jgi:hypothetical protein
MPLHCVIAASEPQSSVTICPWIAGQARNDIPYVKVKPCKNISGIIDVDGIIIIIIREETAQRYYTRR